MRGGRGAPREPRAGSGPRETGRGAGGGAPVTWVVLRRRARDRDGRDSGPADDHQPNKSLGLHENL